VAIGTHDYDTIEGPFTYEALPPNEINFAPLNQTKVFSGSELMTFYEVQYLWLAFFACAGAKPGSFLLCLD